MKDGLYDTVPIFWPTAEEIWLAAGSHWARKVALGAKTVFVCVLVLVVEVTVVEVVDTMDVIVLK